MGYYGTMRGPDMICFKDEVLNFLTISLPSPEPPLTLD